MKAEFLKKEENKVVFTMSFTGEEFDAATDAAFKANRGRFAIDGFRKGKAPRGMIEKWYGEGVFFDDAVENLLNDNYSAALDQINVDPIDRPHIEFGEEKFEKGKGFTVTVTAEVAPEIEIKNYKGVEAERKVRKVTDADVDEAMEAMRRRNGRMVVVERAAENGDTVLLDYAGFVGTKQFDGGTADNQTLKLGSGSFIPGFEDQLVGVKAGESKDVVVTFPADYHEESLAGKEATFKCTVHEVKTEELPELNDDFAKDVSEFDTLAEVRADQKKQLEEEAQRDAEYNGKSAALSKLVEENPVTVPAVMIEDEIDNIMQEFHQQLAYSGMKLADYCKILNKTEADVRADFKEEAEQSVKTKLVISAVAKAEGIEATEEDIEAEYKKLADQYKMEVEKVKEALAMDNSIKYVKQDIVTRKALQFVYDNAKFKDVTEEPAKVEQVK